MLIEGPTQSFMRLAMQSTIRATITWLRFHEREISVLEKTLTTSVDVPQPVGMYFTNAERFDLGTRKNVKIATIAYEGVFYDRDTWLNPEEMEKLTYLGLENKTNEAKAARENL